MNLAYNLDNEYVDGLNSQAQALVDKLVNFDYYKNCKDFVKLVNSGKCFNPLLLLFELNYFKNFGGSKVGTEFLDNFKHLIEALEVRIGYVKSYPDKRLKEKFLRIDPREMELFSLMKLRYSHILNDAFPAITAEMKAFSNKKDRPQSSFDFNQLKNMPALLQGQFILGMIYAAYSATDSDILIPSVKELIKKLYFLKKKYSIVFPAVTFEKANEIVSEAYAKALKELAN